MTDSKAPQIDVPQLMRYRKGGKYHIRRIIQGHKSVSRPLCALNAPGYGTFVTQRKLADTPIGLLCEKCKKKLPVGTYQLSGGVYTVYPNGTSSLAPTMRAEQLINAARASLATVAKNGRDVVRPPSKPATVRKETNTERSERYKAFTRGVAQSAAGVPPPPKPIERARQTIGDMLRKR